MYCHLFLILLKSIIIRFAFYLLNKSVLCLNVCCFIRLCPLFVIAVLVEDGDQKIGLGEGGGGKLASAQTAFFIYSL